MTGALSYTWEIEHFYPMETIPHLFLLDGWRKPLHEWRSYHRGRPRYSSLRLGPHEIRWLTNGTQLKTRQLPLSLLLDKHQRYAKLPLDAVAAIGSLLRLTARQDGCIIVVHT